MPSKGEEKYQQYYRSVTVNGDGADTDQLVLELGNEGQVSWINITGPDAQDYSIVVREQDGSLPEVKYKMAGNSNYSDGDFDEPLFEFGAAKEIVVQNDTSLNADDYAINIRIDELTG